MAGRPAFQVRLSDAERAELEALLRCGSCTVAEQRRARIVLLAAAGESTPAIAGELKISLGTVSRWRGRVARRGLGSDVHQALADEPREGRPCSISPAARMGVVGIACDPLPDASGLSGWTLDLLVEELSIRDVATISRSSVHRILMGNDVKPHRYQMWLHSPDPLFREKVAEICQLYLHRHPAASSSASTRRRAFKPSSASIRIVPLALGVLRATSSNTSVMAPSRCWLRSTFTRAR
jgi:transposase